MLHRSEGGAKPPAREDGNRTGHPMARQGTTHGSNSGNHRPTAGPTRRRLLKGAAAAGGLAAGSGMLQGFPTIWAQNIKDVVLHHAGPPVTAIPAIAEQATKDLGFTVQMQATENADLLNRFLSQSSAIDCADVSITYMKYLVGRRHPADHPARQSQALGPDHPAVHQGRLSRRTRGVEAGHRALHGAVCHRSRLARGSPPDRPSG